MPNLRNAAAWISDLVRVLVLARFNPRYRRASELASTACRSLWFHERSKIRPKPLRELVAMLNAKPVSEVVLPGPETDLGDIGSQTGYHVLGSLVRALEPKFILETGTYLGVSAYAMALNAPDHCRIFTVDLPDDARSQDVPELNAIDRGHIVASRYRVGEAFLRAPVRPRITQIREDSMSFRAEKWIDRAEFIYVDGGHSLPCITRDTENAFRVLDPDGAILWDDYFHLYPDVVSYLDELADRYPLHGIAGTNYVLYSRRWDRETKAEQK
jgi:hypothetical protein